MADRLRLEAGDRVLAVETDRGILLTPYDPETDRALKVAAKAAKKYRNALRTLAKYCSDETSGRATLVEPSGR
jgi:antitoxin MazE